MFAVAFFMCYPDSDIRPSIKSICLALLGAETLPGLRYLWFVPYILFCYILIPYLYSIKDYCHEKTTVQALIVYLSVVVFFQVIGFAFKSFFLPDRIVSFVIAFFLPDIFSRLSVTSKRSLIIVSIVIGLVAWVIRYYVRYVYSGQYVQFAGLYDRYSMCLAALAIFLALMTLFRNARGNRFIVHSDRLSYYIYLVHGLWVFGPFAVLALTAYLGVNIILLFILILLSASLLSVASNKIKFICKW